MMELTLKRRINFFSAISITVSMIVGSGLFGLPGLILNQVSPIESILSWFMAAIIAVPLIYIFAFLGTNYPVADGVVKYGEVAFGKRAIPVVSFIACGTLAVALPPFFIIIGEYVAELFSINAHLAGAFFAIGVVLFSSIFNLLGPEKASIVSKLILLPTILVTVGLTFTYMPQYKTETDKMINNFSWSNVNRTNLWTGSAIAFWAFEGWENLSFGLEEFNRKTNSIYKIYFISFLLILAIYIPYIITIASICASGEHDVSGLNGLHSLLGTGTYRILLLSILCLILISNSISWTFGTSRALFSTARRFAPHYFLSQLDKNSLPKNSIFICALYNCLAIVSIKLLDIPIKHLFLITTQNFTILYLICIIAYFKMCKRTTQRMLGIVAIAGCIFLVSGFTWHWLFPVIIGALGWFIFRLNPEFNFKN